MPRINSTLLSLQLLLAIWIIKLKSSCAITSLLEQIALCCWEIGYFVKFYLKWSDVDYVSSKDSCICLNSCLTLFNEFVSNQNLDASIYIPCKIPRNLLTELYYWDILILKLFSPQVIVGKYHEHCRNHIFIEFYLKMP